MQESTVKYSVQIPSDVTVGLVPGLYHLFVIASSDQVSSVAERRIDIEAVTGEVPALVTPTASPSVVATPTATPTSGGRGFSCSGPLLARSSR